MDYTSAAINYALLLIPTFFALSVMGQGIYKMRKQDPSGKTIMIMGIVFLLLIPVVYFFLIKI